MNTGARPVLKWAGGTGQLLGQLEAALPARLTRGEEFTYVEPFVGGGAMLFFMLQRFPNIRRVVINDINPHLTQAYRTVRDEAEALVARLKEMERLYFELQSEEVRKAFYLTQREAFNRGGYDAVEGTALLMFLNRTCFNGLYRENSHGAFNVPFGRYANPNISNEEVIRADSALLQLAEIEILNGDFAAAVDRAIDLKENLMFCYFDPPYRPLSATSSFNSYVKEAFNDDEQRRLAALCRQLSLRGDCLWMLSNSDCSAANQEDTFFENLYEGFDIHRVYASRSVNANASKRGKLTELLIRNYVKQPTKPEEMPIRTAAIPQAFQVCINF